MKAKIIFSVILVGYAIIFICGCHKDNGCPNIPPADFTINESNAASGTAFVSYQSDTTTGYWVNFSALLDSAQYKWIIGSGIYTTQNVQLNFANVPNNSIIPITLIAYKTAITKCYNDVQNADTITKNMVVNRTDHMFIGQWAGYYIDTTTGKPLSTDSLTIVTIKNIVNNINDSTPTIEGITPTIDSSLFLPSEYYKELVFSVSNGVTAGYVGYALVDSTNNNITIDLHWEVGISVKPPVVQQVHEIFKAKRL